MPSSGQSTLQARKQQFVRDEIWGTAMDLFAEKGFDETTVEDIAAAAGVSRRSFFRYFSSKSDLMAQGIVAYGTALTALIDNCPRACSPPEILRQTVLEFAQEAAAHPRTRKIVQIAAKYPAAREAQLSRMGEVQEQVMRAYARRYRQNRRSDFTPRVLASLTLSLIDLTIQSWFEDEREDITAAVKQVFTTAGQLLCQVG